VEEALHGTACISILLCVLGFKTVLEEGSIAVAELNCPAVFMVKHLIYIDKVVGPDFLSYALKHHSVIPICLQVNITLRL
jgi:hypothetical protein